MGCVALLLILLCSLSTLSAARSILSSSRLITHLPLPWPSQCSPPLSCLSSTTPCALPVSIGVCDTVCQLNSFTCTRPSDPEDSGRATCVLWPIYCVYEKDAGLQCRAYLVCINYHFYYLISHWASIVLPPQRDWKAQRLSQVDRVWP